MCFRFGINTIFNPTELTFISFIQFQNHLTNWNYQQQLLFMSWTLEEVCRPWQPFLLNKSLCSNLSSHPIFHLSSQDMCRREHAALLRLSQYAFLHVKPPWQPPNHFHLLLQIFGMHCQTIWLPFQLFLFSEELSNITYSSLLTLTVVQNLVRSNQLNLSHFVIQRQLLPLRRPETPCRPSKSVPSERLRLVEVINFA